MKHRIYSFAGNLRPGLSQGDLRELAQQLPQERSENCPICAVLYVCLVSRCVALVLEVYDDDSYLKWKTYVEECLGTGGEWKNMGKKSKRRRSATLSPGLTLRFNEQIEADPTLVDLLPSSWVLRTCLDVEPGQVQVLDEGSGIASWSRLTVCLKLTGETPHARWTSWQRTVSVVQEQIDSISGVAAFCLRERAVWVVVEARLEVIESLVEEVKAQGDEIRSLKIEDRLSPDTLRFDRNESVALQLLSSERLLCVPLSVYELHEIQQQSIVPYLPACTLS